MKFKTVAAAALMSLAAMPALAETFEVKMLNRGETGNMVFEPRFVAAQVGDTVRFVPTDKGHSAESIDEMLPEGQEAFKGRINEEIEIELTAEGVMGVECKPHTALGMVMAIQVGDAPVPEGFLDVKLPRKAASTFEEIVDENLGES
ncbi:pseudoazurin [Jannaschia rubra]|uniref:Pseudoazurin n=1 Tax=Jannaschia rubra TaxID=282197 RepID=A0A0M6XWV6_9RHOB|nr:pseudoazurin [Jannaschia rubra]CTQ34761.1 Pseudoazurin precursor [Jannaschia rubra]SFG70350.1 pseudoazurin [Jannaschia rubra]